MIVGCKNFSQFARCFYDSVLISPDTSMQARPKINVSFGSSIPNPSCSLLACNFPLCFCRVCVCVYVLCSDKGTSLHASMEETVIARETIALPIQLFL